MADVFMLAGPTASGKTECSIRIARELGCEIVSCDSMQLYRFMDIGSAKPSEEELRAVPHHLIGEIDPRERMTVAKYRNLAREAVFDILDRGKTPLVCGGSGLYMDALMYDMDFAAAPGDSESRKEYYRIAEESGPEKLHSMLADLSPESAARIHPNNVKRVVRALEAVEAGEPVGDFDAERKPAEGYDCVLAGITWDRETLYHRINERVDALMERGLLEEVKGLVDMGLTAEDISMKGIGYKELIGHLNGEYDLEEAVRLVKRNTRHYAKRQMTWFRRYKDMKWFNASECGGLDRVSEELAEWLKRRS